MVDTALLGNKAMQRQYAAGQRVMPDEGASELYIVVSGRVDLYRISPARKLEKFGAAHPGQPFGQREFFGFESGLVYAAGEDSVVYVISDRQWDAAVKAQPRLPYELLETAYAGSSGTVRKTVRQPVATAPEAEREQPAEAAPEKAAAAELTGPLFPEGHVPHPDVTHPEYQKYLYQKEYTCPNCRRQFEGERILLSKLVPTGEMRFDLRQDYRDFDMAWYEVLTCPHCYFSMFSDYFTEPKNFMKSRIADALERARDELHLDFDAERGLDFVLASHYLALLCAPGFSNRKSLELRLWSNLSWLYEDAGDRDLEKMAAEKAAETAESIYMESTLNPVQEQVMCLTTAGMQYRAGLHKDVLKWLLSAKTVKLGKKTYALLAENLMDEIRAQKRDTE